MQHHNYLQRTKLTNNHPDLGWQLPNILPNPTMTIKNASATKGVSLGGVDLALTAAKTTAIAITTSSVWQS